MAFYVIISDHLITEPEEGLLYLSRRVRVLNSRFSEQNSSRFLAKCRCPKGHVIMAFMHSAFSFAHKHPWTSMDRPVYALCAEVKTTATSYVHKNILRDGIWKRLFQKSTTIHDIVRMHLYPKSCNCYRHCYVSITNLTPKSRTVYSRIIPFVHPCCTFLSRHRNAFEIDQRHEK